MPASHLPDSTQKEILNVDEAAAYLGVSTKTFQKVLREGEMPGRKVGREWKFARRALEAWIAGGKSSDFLDLEERAAHEETTPETPPPAVPRGNPAAGRTTARPPPSSGRRPGAVFQDDED